jgi:hypothetical protein
MWLFVGGIVSCCSDIRVNETNKVICNGPHMWWQRKIHAMSCRGSVETIVENELFSTSTGTIF